MRLLSVPERACPSWCLAANTFVNGIRRLPPLGELFNQARSGASAQYFLDAAAAPLLLVTREDRRTASGRIPQTGDAERKELCLAPGPCDVRGGLC